MTDRTSSDPPQSQADDADLFSLIVAERKVLAAGFADLNRTMEMQRNRIRVLETALSRWSEELDSLLDNYRRFFTFNASASRGQERPELVVEDERLGVCAVSTKYEADLNQSLIEARSTLRESIERRFGGRLREHATEIITSISARLKDLEATRDGAQAGLLSLRNAKVAQLAEMRMAADERLSNAVAMNHARLAQNPAPAQPWNAYPWQSWAPGSSSSALFAGYLVPDNDPDLGDNARFGASTYLPFYLSARSGLQFRFNRPQRDQALGLMRSLLARIITAERPGEARFALFDPVGLGSSMVNVLELGEYDSELISGKVWSSSGDLAMLLQNQTSFLELVIQKYLKNSYASIHDYNVDAGEVAEPYRYLVICDFPSHFTEESLIQICRVIENGPRCGIFTILLNNLDLERPHWYQDSLLPESLYPVHLGAPFQIEIANHTMQMHFWPESDADIPAGVMNAIIEKVGRAAIEQEESVVHFDRTMRLFADGMNRGTLLGARQLAVATTSAATTWWQNETTEGVSAPLGQAGARDVAVLTFDSGEHSGALLVGRPGSGKSTLLHTFISAVSMLYSPEELELYLIDFKEGVEFKQYATHGLPHARCVAVETDREFGLSVLSSIAAEISRRGELFRRTGGAQTNIVSLRRATGERLPRIILVFDEFHVLFSRNDKVGVAAADLLEGIVRQGRGFGVHVLLGSQSLSGLDALGSHVPQLLPVRILLPAADADARRVLGEDNDAGNYLIHRGEAILNQSGGQVEANENFRVAYEDELERTDLLMRLRELADSRGFLRRPIVFEGNSTASWNGQDPVRFFEELARPIESTDLALRVAQPMTLGGSSDLSLRRESGANILLVARNDASPRGFASDLELAEGGVADAGVADAFVTAAIASALCAHAQIEIVDFASTDVAISSRLSAFDSLGSVSIARSRALGEVLDRVHRIVQTRADEQTRAQRPMLLVLYGVHRARGLDAESVDYDDEAAASAQGLLDILRDGPDVGVHTVIWTENLSSLSRRLSSSMIREFGWRVAGKMSADDSQSLLNADVAASLSERQLVVTNDDYGLTRRSTAFEQPSLDWLRRLAVLLPAE